MARERKTLTVACENGPADAVLCGGPWAFKIGERKVVVAATNRWGTYPEDLTHVHSGYRFLNRLWERPERGIRQKALAAFNERVQQVGEAKVLAVLDEFEAKPAISNPVPLPESHPMTGRAG